MTSFDIFKFRLLFCISQNNNFRTQELKNSDATRRKEVAARQLEFVDAEATNRSCRAVLRNGMSAFLARVLRLAFR